MSTPPVLVSFCYSLSGIFSDLLSPQSSYSMFLLIQHLHFLCPKKNPTVHHLLLSLYPSFPNFSNSSCRLLSSVLFQPSWASHCIAAIAHTHTQLTKYEFFQYKCTDGHPTPTSLIVEVHFIHQYTWSIMTVFHPLFFFLNT